MVDKCVHCGWCCRNGPCPWGEVTSPTDRSCKFLVPGKPGRWLCGKYDEIIGQPTAEISPAFGAGCCATLFNTDRERILMEIKEEANETVNELVASETLH